MHSVLLIDDHDIVRFGLETLVLSCADLRLAGSAANLQEGLARVREARPDLVISDLNLPDSQGLNTVRALVEAQEPRHTLIVSMQDEALYGPQVLSAGAGGYLPKEHAHAHLISAMMTVVAGDIWTTPQLSSLLLNRRLRRRAAAGDPDARQGESALTLRELQVLEQLGAGKSTKEIASVLELSVRTVDLHRANMKKKLCLRTGAELIAFASQRLQ